MRRRGFGKTRHKIWNMEYSQTEKRGLFDALHPKVAFFGGVITGVLVLGTIGFFVLLGVVLKGGALSLNSVAEAGTAAINDPQTPEPIPPSGLVGAFRPVDESRDHIQGQKDAPVTLIEYSDLECPFCKRFHPTAKKMLETYPGKVRLVYRHFPLTSLHQKAQTEAEAVECAAKLGGNDAFWKLIDKIFEITPSNDGLDLAQLPRLAQEIGLNKSKFEKCWNGGEMRSRVDEDARDAVSAGGTGTPFTIVVDAKGNTFPVTGAVPFEQLDQVVKNFIQ